MSFNGCIGNMKASGLEVLVGTAFSGLTWIMNGKAWVRSMLYDFLKDGPKTFEDISQGGGLSPYFNSCLIRVLAAKHLPCSSPTPIHITPVLLHP